MLHLEPLLLLLLLLPSPFRRVEWIGALVEVVGVFLLNFFMFYLFFFLAFTLTTSTTTTTTVTTTHQLLPEAEAAVAAAV